MNGYGAVGDARKRMHPGDAAQHRANLEFSARERAKERVAELEADLAAARAEVADRDRRLAAVEALADEWEANAEAATKRGYPAPWSEMTFAQEHHAKRIRAALGDADTLAEEGCRPGCKPGGACKWIGCENHDERVRAQERGAVLDEVERIVAERVREAERRGAVREREQQADRLTSALYALWTLPSDERRRGKEEGVKLALSYIREDQRADRLDQGGGA